MKQVAETAARRRNSFSIRMLAMNERTMAEAIQEEVAEKAKINPFELAYAVGVKEVLCQLYGPPQCVGREFPEQGGPEN